MQGNLTSIWFEGDVAVLPVEEVGAYVTLLRVAGSSGVTTYPNATERKGQVVVRFGEVSDPRDRAEIANDTDIGAAAGARLVARRIGQMTHTPRM